MIRTRAQRVATLVASTQGAMRHLAPGEVALHARLANVTLVADATVLSHLEGNLSTTLAGVTLDSDVTVETPTGETVTFTVQPASFDSRRRAAIDGVFGPTRSGLYWRIPGNGMGNYYVWWSHDDGTGRQVGVDPGDWVAELSGYTGIEVALSSGNHSASSVATATRTAVDAIYATVGGSGAEVVITDAIDSGACTVGGMKDATRGQWGSRRGTSQFTGNDLNGRVSSFGVSPGTDVIVTAIGMLLDVHETQVRMALYSGGTDNSLVGTTLECEGITTGSGTGWNWIVLAPADVIEIPASTNLRLVAKSNGTSEPGYISTGDLVGTDFSGDALEIYDTMSTDPTVAFPSTLEGEGTTTSAAYVLMGIQYTEVGTGTTHTFYVGIHSDDVLGASQSDLTSPDPLGANVLMGQVGPALLGLELDYLEIGVGGTHTDQFRIGLAIGGSEELPEDATVEWDGGQTTGSSTNAWVRQTAPMGGSAIPVGSADRLWWWLRGNGNITVRYADNASPTTVDPDHDPMEYPRSSGSGDGSEYEMNTLNENHSTDDADAFESPVITGADSLPGNYPASRIGLRIPADSVS